jgi:hypothetical protein
MQGSTTAGASFSTSLVEVFGLVSVRAGNEDLETASKRIRRDPCFVRAGRVLSACNYRRLDALATMSRDTRISKTVMGTTADCIDNAERRGGPGIGSQTDSEALGGASGTQKLYIAVGI